MALQPTRFEFHSLRNVLNRDLPPAQQHLWEVTVKIVLEEAVCSPPQQQWNGRISVHTESSAYPLAKVALCHALRHTLLELEKP